MINRQSERDIPRGLMRHGLTDGTKCQSSERKGNLFILIRITHTSKECLVIQRAMGTTDDTWRKFKAFLKLFIGMEEWFHDSNDKAEVCKLLGLISTDGNSCEEVIQCSVQPILWAKVETNMLVKFTLGTDINVSYVTVPVEAIVGGDPN
jgi:hypothetical protein